MASSLKDFGETAKGLAKNPLGIIALFIVLIYGFASLIVGFSDKLTTVERMPIIWFLVIFPVAVLAVFAWLVHIPFDSGHPFRFIPATDSAPFRPPIPVIPATP